MYDFLMKYVLISIHTAIYISHFSIFSIEKSAFLRISEHTNHASVLRHSRVLKKKSKKFLTLFIHVLEAYDLPSHLLLFKLYTNVTLALQNYEHSDAKF